MKTAAQRAPYTCDNSWIHRQFSRKVDEIQCPACGAKVRLFQDEDHRVIEADHRRVCRVIHPTEPLTNHER